MWIQSEQKCKSSQLFLDKDNLYHVRNRFDNEKNVI